MKVSNMLKKPSVGNFDVRTCGTFGGGRGGGTADVDIGIEVVVIRPGVPAVIVEDIPVAMGEGFVANETQLRMLKS